MKAKGNRKKKLVVANWKMNPATLEEARKIFTRTKKAALSLTRVETVVCPPTVFLPLFVKSASKSFSIGAQNCFSEDVGSFTGEISPAALADIGVSYVIIGHSERRERGEGDEIVSAKVQAAIRNALTVIVCIGEKTRTDDGHYLAFLKDQLNRSLAGVEKKFLSRLIVAYEPVWAIGATEPMQASDIHGMTIFIKKILGELFGSKEVSEVPILYGGSVTSENALSIMRAGMVDGLLVGRDSLSPQFPLLLQAVNQA